VPRECPVRAVLGTGVAILILEGAHLMSATRRQQEFKIEPGIRRIVMRSGTEKYRVQLGNKGKGNRRSRLVATYDEAQAVKAAWIAGGLPPAGAHPVSSRHDVIATVDDGFRHRALDLEQRGKGSAVTDRIRVFLKRHWPEGTTLSLSDVTVAHVEEYRRRRFDTPTERRKDRCADNTVIRELREWRAMLKKARPDFKLPADVFPKEHLIRVRMLTPEQYKAVFPYLAERYGAVFADMSELALLGVMRQSDVRLLQRKHVNVAVGVLELPHTKGGEPRLVRLSPEALVIITRSMARDPRHEYVFANPRTAEPYSRVHVSRCWRQAAQACGLPDFTFHDLRHHGPTVAVNHGASPDVLMALGGWKSPKMTQRYASVLNPTVDKFLGDIGRSGK
jgi:integrase